MHGYRARPRAVERILTGSPRLTVERAPRACPGLHPDRAPTIVAGAVILLESMRAFDLEQIEVSEADILHGRRARRL